MKWVLTFVEILISHQILCQIVPTEDGKIEGTVLQTRLGTDFYAFRRVPFAQPPIDSLRFKAPLPVKPWENVLNCTAYGPVCWQVGRSPASEDCLHLNVFSKTLPQGNYTNLKPVIAFLHSGGFQSGAAMDYGPEYLLDRDIVLVTINYRLGAFGFLALETEDIPGNAGLKDQSLALKWIQRNIRYFGGDPQKVTLGGIATTSNAVAAHMVSPMSKGLFHRAIIMSGGLNSNLRSTTNNLDMAKGIAQKLNCSSNSVHQIARCFKSKSPEDIVNNSPPQYFRCFYVFWTPVIERNFGQARFLTDDIETLIRRRKFPNITVLSGTSDEYFSSAVAILRSANDTAYLNKYFNELAPTCFLFQRTQRLSENEISQRLRDFYIPFSTIDNRSRSDLHQLFCDSNIVYANHKLVHYLSGSVPVYYYKVTFLGRFSRYLYPRSLPYGVAHGDDLQYMFYPNIVTPYKVQPTDAENVMVERMTRIWERFAHFGDPNNAADPYLSTMVWPKHDKVGEIYLDIGNNLIEKNGKDLRSMRVWEEIFNPDIRSG